MSDRSPINPIGLVLSGGGAKGAYQAGVWKAMVESGVANRVRAISGTSVGAVNAALFVSIRDPVRIQNLWTRHVSAIPRLNLKGLEPGVILETLLRLSNGKQFPGRGILDRSVLESLLQRTLPETWPVEAPPIYASTLECVGNAFSVMDQNSYRLRNYRIYGKMSKESRALKILASAAIPWAFDPVEINGRTYVDGGWEEMGGENIPISPIVKRHPELETIYVIRCNSNDVEPGNLPSIPGKKIIEIRPSKTLPGMFDDFLPPLPLLRVWSACFSFDPSFAAKYYSLGYHDGKRHFIPENPFGDAHLKW